MAPTDPLRDQVQALNQELRGLRTKVEGKIGNHDTRLQTLETDLLALKNIDEEQGLRDSLQQLEHRLSQLKARLVPQQKTFWARIGSLRTRVRDWIKSNWTFLAFVATAASVFYVYEHYGVSYFEAYQNTANAKQSAKNYKETGDALLARAEFRAADEAYQAAVAINPNYIEARQDLMRTQILNSVEAYSTYAPVAVEAKLKYLERISPDDYLIPYVRGIVKIDRDKQDEARGFFMDSLNKNSEFVGNYIELGYLDLFKGEIGPARENFNRALSKVPDHLLALYNLGLCDMLSLNFKSAIKQMEGASSSERLEILLNLGEAYRNDGDIDTAVVRHEAAQKLLQDPKLKEGVNYRRATFNFIPQSKEDKNTLKIFAQALTLDQYKSLIYYALSIDYALQRRFSDANRAFGQGYRFDQTINGEKEFGCLYLNRSDFVTGTHKIAPAVLGWFTKKRPSLDRHHTCLLQEKLL